MAKSARHRECVSIDAARAAPTVAIDLSRLDGPADLDAATLEQALVMRLLQEGCAIDPLTAKPEITVTVSGGAGVLVLSAKSQAFEERRYVDITRMALVDASD